MAKGSYDKMFRTALKVVGGGLSLAVGGTAGVCAYKYNTDPGMKRTMQ